jgi:hypothetical protein
VRYSENAVVNIGWVNSGHAALKLQCPLYPSKRTFVGATAMSALGQKRTLA